jgi:hypothetical protein
MQSLELDLTQEDFVTFAVHYALNSESGRQQRSSYRAVLMLASALLSGWIVNVVTRSLLDGLLVAALASVIAYVQASRDWERHMRRGLARASSGDGLGQAGASTLSLDDTGLSADGPAIQVRVAWPAVRKVEDVGTHVFIYFSPRQAFIVPRRGQPEAIDQFTAEVVARIAQDRPAVTD